MATPVGSMPVELDAGELQTRYIELGDMAIRHVSVPAGADMSVLLAGLPNDRCPSPHWGMVLEGSIHLTHGDGSTETARAGEVYHWAAGHTGTTDEPCVFIEVGPVAAMRQFGDNAKRVLAGG
jgi:hypothetical protein